MSANVRMIGGSPDPEGRVLDLARVDLRVDDNTGVSITAPTTATRIGGAPMAVAQQSVDTAAITGAIAVGQRPGVQSPTPTRSVRWSFSEITPVASATTTIEVFYQPPGGAAASVGGKQVFTQTATPVAIPGMSGESPPFAVQPGGIIDVRVTQNTGNFVVKRAQIVCVQVDG